MKRIFAYLVLMFAVAATSAAERPRITSARFEPDTVLIGDRFSLIVEMDKDVVLPVDFPHFDKSFADGKIEVLGEKAPDTLATDGRKLSLRKEYLMTSFEEGHYTLDSLAVLYADKNIVDTLYASERLEIWIGTIPVDTLKNTIYDIKAPMKTPLLVDEFEGYVGFGVLALMVIVAVGYFLSRIKVHRKESAERRRPREAPNVAAIRELEHLHNQKLWQTGQHKQYYTRLTEILREYLDGRFDVGAKEMTSDEILSALSKLELSVKQYKEVEEVLRDADLVKFAKHLPEADRNEESYYKIYYFVEETKQVDQEPKPSEPSNDNLVEL